MDDAALVPTRHKLDVDDYHRMAGAGFFGEDDRIELIDGDLIDMAPIGRVHAGVADALAEALHVACAGRAIVSSRNPLRLDQASEPQPDLKVLRRRADFYTTGDRLGPADVLLLIEVADSSLAFDQDVKLPLYARAGMAEVWIVDLKRHVLWAYRDPSEGGYRTMTTHSSGERVALSQAPDIVVTLTLGFE